MILAARAEPADSALLPATDVAEIEVYHGADVSERVANLEARIEVLTEEVLQRREQVSNLGAMVREERAQKRWWRDRAQERRAVIEKLQSSVGGPANTARAPASSSGFIRPVSGPIISGFGPRWGRMHEGIDIPAPTGAPVYAAAAGTVTFAGTMSGFGNLVIVSHGNVETYYAHLSSIAVYGGSVAQGQNLGTVGCTGRCFGPHLHFETHVGGVAVDPMRFIR